MSCSRITLSSLGKFRLHNCVNQKSFIPKEMGQSGVNEVLWMNKEMHKGRLSIIQLQFNQLQSNSFIPVNRDRCKCNNMETVSNHIILLSSQSDSISFNYRHHPWMDLQTTLLAEKSHSDGHRESEERSCSRINHISPTSYFLIAIIVLFGSRTTFSIEESMDNSIDWKMVRGILSQNSNKKLRSSGEEFLGADKFTIWPHDHNSEKNRILQILKVKHNIVTSKCGQGKGNKNSTKIKNIQFIIIITRRRRTPKNHVPKFSQRIISEGCNVMLSFAFFYRWPVLLHCRYGWVEGCSSKKCGNQIQRSLLMAFNRFSYGIISKLKALCTKSLFHDRIKLTPSHV